MGYFYGRSRAFVLLQARLAPVLKQRLETRAYHLGLSQAAIVNAALEYYFDHMEFPLPDPQEGQGPDMPLVSNPLNKKAK